MQGQRQKPPTTAQILKGGGGGEEEVWGTLSEPSEREVRRQEELQRQGPAGLWGKWGVRWSA